MDELSAFKGAPRQMRQREAELMRRADLVLTGGPSLYESKKQMHRNVHCLPSAVDAQHYDPHGLDALSPAAQRVKALQGTLQSPRIGYFGAIDERIDMALIGGMAQARPEWQFVMVGPVVKIDHADLPRGPNLHWLGQQDYASLPHFVAGWDVCLMPFALNEHTRFISPTKTLEYLAAQKPVVSTRIKDVVDMYSRVVHLADDATGFVAACEAALAEDENARAVRLRDSADTVAQYAWDATAERIDELIAQALSETRPRRAVGAA
jgi:glycosyltransferase involved in cell wall biosynthesis